MGEEASKLFDDATAMMDEIVSEDTALAEDYPHGAPEPEPQ